MEVSDTNLKNVYEEIADKFDKTRYRCWSTVENVLNTFEPNSINGDIGCGNGKNMLYRNDIKFIGIDFCDKFVKICNRKNLECYNSDIRGTMFDDNYFDNTISIAVIHHLDSVEKRISAIKELFRITNVGGTIFIYVWALKQPKDSKRKFISENTMVPFKTNDNIYYRFYHLYRENEIQKEIELSGCKYDLINSGYEMGNYFVHMKKI